MFTLINVLLKNKKLYFRDRNQKLEPDILHVIGNTPLVKLNNIPKKDGLSCDMCKLQNI